MDKFLVSSRTLPEAEDINYQCVVIYIKFLRFLLYFLRSRRVNMKNMLTAILLMLKIEFKYHYVYSSSVIHGHSVLYQMKDQ